MSKWIIRSIAKGDVEFITSTWLKNYRVNSKWGSGLRKNVFFHEHNHLVQRHLAGSKIMVACDPDELGHIFGYLIGKNEQDYDTLHYIYVKGAFRKMGVASDLLKDFRKADSLFYTHEIKKTDLLKVQWPDIVFNPYKFLNGEYAL